MRALITRRKHKGDIGVFLKVAIGSKQLSDNKKKRNITQWRFCLYINNPIISKHTEMIIIFYLLYWWVISCQFKGFVIAMIIEYSGKWYSGCVNTFSHLVDTARVCVLNMYSFFTSCTTESDVSRSVHPCSDLKLFEEKVTPRRVNSQTSRCSEKENGTFDWSAVAMETMWDEMISERHTQVSVSASQN